jgi:hypothetical protein
MIRFRFSKGHSDSAGNRSHKAGTWGGGGEYFINSTETRGSFGVGDEQLYLGHLLEILLKRTVDIGIWKLRRMKVKCRFQL